jgi:hypothetical protein
VYRLPPARIRRACLIQNGLSKVAQTVSASLDPEEVLSTIVSADRAHE